MNDYKNIEHSVIPYDQNEIEQVLKQMMYDRGITDVLYEGSNISQLSSVISYIISTLNVNTAINLQETILPLATKRMNILFGARQLGYEARAKKSFRYDLLLRATINEKDFVIDSNGKYTDQVNPYGTVERDIDLLHNTKFICGRYEYYYTGPTINNFWVGITNSDITYLETTSEDTTGYKVIYDKIYKHIEVKEGTLKTYNDDPTLSLNAEEYQDLDGSIRVKQDYIIPFKDVEEDGLKVYLTYLDENGNYQEHIPREKTTSYLIDENMTQQENLFARVQNIILGFPTIFFQMGGFGNPIRKGTLIEIEALISHGVDGEATGRFEADEDGFVLEYEVYEYKLADSDSLLSKGQNEESNESIKENAIVYHNTANRAVTKYDYEAITKRHQILSDAAAWGGEEEVPKEKGHIWLSGILEVQQRLIKFRKSGPISYYEIKQGEPNRIPAEAPNEDYPTLSNWMLTKDRYEDENWIEGQQSIIKKYLDVYKMMTTEIHYRHPLFVDFDIDCDIIKYDITKSAEEINQGVFYEISDYFKQYIEKFGSEYINSNLQRITDRFLGFNSGISFDVHVTGSLCREMVDEFNLNLDQLETYECPIRTPKTVIKCSLGFPFDGVFDTSTAVSILIPEALPRIDTESFNGSDNLVVDYNGFPSGPNINTDYMETKIYLGNIGDTEFGTYAVNRKTNSIDITFEFTPTGPTSLDTIFGPPMINPGSGAVIVDPITGEPVYKDRNYVAFNIDYPLSVNTSTNIPFTKNTIPRLRNVSFLDN